MKVFWFIIVIIIITGFLLKVMFDSLDKDMNNESDKYKEKLGMKIVVNNDTLMILNYSMFRRTFKLSNGQEISYDLIEKLTVIK